ncbi:CCHC-type domain-containing protein [Trichonephila clavipes]|nr:CCHC-type domain-containing protein [Trichonephila clavipes]
MRSGDLFLEVTSAKQSFALRTLRRMAHIDITVVPHNTLNYSRGVISAADLFNVSTEEIKENMVNQKVCDVRRITIRRDGQVLNTKPLILTFWTPELPQSVKATYLHCPVRPYIPNPLRCFQCQRFGHSKTVCRGQPTCSRCAEVGHDSADCKAKERCVKCKGDHSSFSRSFPTWILEKEITAVKIKNKLSYPEARRVVSLRTPISGKSYASAANKTYKTIAIQVDASTAPKNKKSESEKSKTIAVDTRKTVSTPPNVKKTRKTRIKDSGMQAHKKRGQTSLKNPMTLETMSWKFMHPKATKVYWKICRQNLCLLAPCEEQVGRLDDLLYLL